MEIRFAREDELDRVNELRKQVNDLHVEGKPDVFKAGFNDELYNHIYDIWNDPEQEIVVADADGIICGFAVVHHIYKAENPFMFERDFIDVDEFCVDERFRRQGIATEMSDGTLWEGQIALYFRWTCLPDCAVPELDADYRRNNRRLS